MKLELQITFRIKDIMRICRVSKTTASRHRRAILKQFDIPPGGYIFLEHFCAYFKLTEEKILKLINTQKL